MSKNYARNFTSMNIAMAENEHQRKGPDFTVTGGGTVYLLCPHTQAARDWIADNVDPDHQSLGDNVAVGHRYIADIVAGIQSDGLTVQ